MIRKTFKLMFKFIIILCTICILDIYFELNFPYIENVEIKNDKITSELKILNICDIHNKSFGKDNIKLKQLIASCDFDIIVCTGDVVDEKEEQIEFSKNFFSLLVSFNKPVFYVSGNHEKWENWSKIKANAQELGVTVLDNKNTVVSNINICGIEDFNTKYHNINASFDGINNELYTILLSHTPAIIGVKTAHKADLILSGHTHGGQVSIPFYDSLLEFEKENLKEYPKGLFELDENTMLYVDSGLGTTRIPIRFFNRSKITLLTLKGV